MSDGFKDVLAAFAAGLGGADYNAIQLQKERLRLQQEQERRQQQAATASKQLDREKFQLQTEEAIQAMEKISRELEEAEAKKTAATGVRRGETLTAFTPQGQESTGQALFGTSEEAQRNNQFRPGLYQEQLSQDEQFAEVLRQEELDKVARASDQQSFANDISSRTANRQDEQLALNQKSESRQARQTSKNIERIDQQLKDARGEGVQHMTTAQSAQIVDSIYGDAIDEDDPQATSKYIGLIKAVEDLHNNPSKAGKIAVQQALAAIEQRHTKVFKDDEVDEGSGDLKGDIEELDGLLGEGMNQKEQQQEAPMHLPAQDGVPDPRAQDPSVPLQSLVGGDERVNQKIQEQEMMQDAQTNERLIRQLIEAGVEQELWPNQLRAYVEAIRDPNKLKALFGQ